MPRSTCRGRMSRPEPTIRRRVRPSFVLRTLGWACLLAAALIAGALAWQLWGTGLGTARSQHALRQALEPRLTEAAGASTTVKAPAAFPTGHLADGEALAV